MTKVLMKGNEALGEAAIRANCRNYFAYPITPQTEIAEYMVRRLPEVGGHFVQAESELGAVNMVYGAAAVGERVFTSSSSPGVALMSEAISYLAGSQLPAVLINIVRGGPGLGGILPAQSDYFMATKAGGHGDFRLLVLAPAGVQEAADLVMDAFDLADKYRNPVMIIGDGMIGQMMEPVEFREYNTPEGIDRSYANTGAKDRPPTIVKSLFLDPQQLENNNLELLAKYRLMEQHEIRFEEYAVTDKMDVLVVSYGMMARICKTAIDELNQEGHRVGIVRPITLFPFPSSAIYKAAARARKV
ncbi:3-methyl-2-oxobutanoate dehydrogenase subunit VorB, partial [bacterium]|nr:3-methyl-2-oxobutanoate dehydrogenase subunit VorB [bacterium]